MYDELMKRLMRYVKIEREEHHGADLEAEAASAIMMLSTEIEKYRHASFVIGEICVDASKQHISPEGALQKIRENIYYTRRE